MMNRSAPLTGLIAASFTPLRKNGSLHLERILQIVDYLIKNGIAGMYVLGSTGEGVSFTQEERLAVAEAFVEAAGGRLPVIVQVGCESLLQARQLATHAQEIGADAISAVSPLYFKPDSVETLVDSMAEIASGAPELPFYYYHIPAVTGVDANMMDFLRLGGQRIATLRGIKYTSQNVPEFQACVEYAADQFEILWGLDEMLFSGLSAGASAAVGSTYNFAAPIYQRLLSAFATGAMEEAHKQQARSQALVRTFAPFGSRAAQKSIMAMVGVDCGPCRLPVKSLNPANVAALHEELEAIDFFEWISERFVVRGQIA